LVGTNLGHQPGSGNTDGAIQAGGDVNGLMQQVRRPQRRPMQALGAGHIEVGLVYGDHFDLGREILQDLVDCVGIVAIAVRMAIHKEGVRAKLSGGAQGHGGVHAKFAGFI
jgi:hypothetical protein